MFVTTPQVTLVTLMFPAPSRKTRFDSVIVVGAVTMGVRMRSVTRTVKNSLLNVRIQVLACTYTQVDI